MSNNLKFEDFKDEFKLYYNNSSDSAHRGDHIIRVLHNGITIAKTVEGCDIDVVLTACILHDICRATEVNDHAIEGSILAKQVLEDKNVLTKSQILKVCECIRTHRYSAKIKAKSIEGSILQDADRLDSLGPIGIVRTLKYTIHKGLPIYDPNIKPAQHYDKNTPSTTAINHMIEKKLSMKPESFQFTESKKIAKKYYNFTKEFVELYIEAYKI